MGSLLYNFLVWGFIGLAKFTALFNAKARAFVNGRKDLFSKLIENFEGVSEKLIWFHCASLGEFEQGRPILERLKADFPRHKILLTFFSPSGYEVRKNYPAADFVFYLPYDLPGNAHRFISITKPALAIFIKYEFWPNYFSELKRQNVPIISVSSIFREEQIFFKFYGGFMRKSLQSVNHFFVQNQNSAILLSSLGLTNISISGDTRFDRVFQITQNLQENFIAKKFKADQPCWVVGSCWPADMEMLTNFINVNRGKLKFILAPHEISQEFTDKIIASLEVKSVLYSQTNADFANASVLIIDNVGLLSQLYRYGDFAYVGGGFGKGLHNILEAACYGIPIFFGNGNYQKFQEAVDLIAQGGAFAVSGFEDLKSNYDSLAGEAGNYVAACNASRNYVSMKLGAAEIILAYCKKLLMQHEG